MLEISPWRHVCTRHATYRSRMQCCTYNFNVITNFLLYSNFSYTLYTPSLVKVGTLLDRSTVASTVACCFVYSLCCLMELVFFHGNRGFPPCVLFATNVQQSTICTEKNRIYCTVYLTACEGGWCYCMKNPSSYSWHSRIARKSTFVAEQLSEFCINCSQSLEVIYILYDRHEVKYWV